MFFLMFVCGCRGWVSPARAMLAPIRLTRNLSVSPTRLRRYCCAVRRDARHTVRGQPRRKALRSYPTGQVRRKEKHPRPAPHLSRPYGLICRGAADELDLVAVRVIDVHGTAGENGMLAAARLVTGSH